jgi:hypothetical protein
MWKAFGVVGLWALMIVVPHLGTSGTSVTLAGVVPSLSPPNEDLGDPPPQAPSAQREIPGAFATIHFKNALGKTLTLAEARLTMDGKSLPVVTNLATDRDAVVFAGRVAAGAHAVETHVTCRGKRRGPFTYLKEYTWEVTSEETLTVPADRAVIFTISAVRNKGVNVPFDRQLGITVHDEVLPHPVSLRN